MPPRSLTYTLISDGSSDVALLPILTHLLRTHLADFEILAQWADLRNLRHPPANLPERIERGLDQYPCDLLFVHRDAEKEAPTNRVEEIVAAIDLVRKRIPDLPPYLCVVPVRMSEAWLLISEKAIRIAADNPTGTQRLSLPRISQLETIADPKEKLYSFLRTASGKTGADLHKFNVARSALRVADSIGDFSLLRQLSAFQQLEDDLQKVIADQGWK